MSDNKAFKMVVVGAAEAGKSAFCHRVVSGEFRETYEPTVEDLFKLEKEVGDQTVSVHLLDTAGGDEFSTMRDMWIERAHAFVVVYSITKEETFAEARAVLQSITEAHDFDSAVVPVVLVGTSCEAEGDDRKVSAADGEDLAKEFSAGFFETSAVDGTNCAAAVHHMVSAIIAAREQAEGGSRVYKMVIVGASRVGKTAMAHRYAEGAFSEEYTPTVEDVHRADRVYNNEAVDVHILDTSGSDEFAAMRDIWLGRAHAFVVVYSVTDAASFETAGDILTKIDDAHTDDSTTVPVALAANFADAEGDDVVVTEEQGRQLAEDHGATFFSTSAASGQNLEDTFEHMVVAIRKSRVHKAAAAGADDA